MKKEAAQKKAKSEQKLHTIKFQGDQEAFQHFYLSIKCMSIRVYVCIQI